MLLKQLLVVLIVGVTVCRASIQDGSTIDDNNTDCEDCDNNDDWDDDDDDSSNLHPDFESLQWEAEDTEEYWSDDYWELPDDGRQCSEGQEMGADGTCVECSAGYYNQDWFRVDVCMACEVGTYVNYTGATECEWCREELTNFWTGSTSSSDCVDKSVRLDTAYLTTVKAWVSVTGDLCSQISDMFYGITAIQFYEASFTQCDYDEESDISSMALKISPPTRYAMDVYYAFSIVEAHREMLNAYISLGPHYAELAFDFLNNSMLMDWFGLNMDIDQLNIEDFRIVSFDASFEDHCSSGYSKGANGLCVESDATAASPASMPYYLSYVINMDVCADNAGQTMARNFIDEWGIENFLPYSCLENGTCSTEFMFCESRDSARTVGSSESYLVMKLDVYSSDAMADYPFDADWDISSVAENVTVSWDNTTDGCSNGVEFDSDYSPVCLDSCEPGQYLDAAGFCVNCPFTTWSNDSESCNSCPWYTETPFWGMDSEDMCIETENWWKDESTATGGDSEWLRDLGGRLDFNLALEPRIDFCGIASAKQSLDAWCSSSDRGDDFDDLDASEDDVQIDSAQEFICYYSNRFSFYYEDFCGSDFDMSWDEAWDAIDFEDGEGVEDLICVVVKRLYDMDGDADLSNDCAGVDNNILDMPFSFDGEMDSDGASILVPMLTGMKKLETMSFDSFAKAGENFMERFGMYDMNALTGLDIANDLRDFASAVPSGLSMQQFDFDVSYDESEFFCADGGVLRECEHEWCDDWSCSKKDSDSDKDIYCRFDACNNCAEMWFYHNDTTGGEQEFECATCDFPDSIDNGYKIQSWSTSGDSAYYACNSGYKLKDCNNYAWCDINNSDDYSLPECEENTCEFDEEIENGYLVEQWNSDDYWDSCPWGRYICNPGWEIEGDNYVRCYSDEIEFPTCVEACSFPLYIENGMNVENYTTWNGKWEAKYECIDGYFPSGEAKCSEWQQTEDGSWEESRFIPECLMAATCEFPQEVNGATMEHEYMDESTGQKYAQYHCDGGYRSEGPTHVECEGENRDEVNFEFLCIDEDEYCWYNWGAVENGWVYRSDNNALWFQCGDRYEMEGEERARCENGEAIYPECVYREPECDLPGWIENGWVAEDHGDSKRYECNEWDGWMIPGDGWAYCNGTEVENWQECVRFTCDFEQYIDNGNLSSVSDNGIHAWYYCYDGYRFVDEDSGASCDADGNYEYPECMENGDPCAWPETIDNGNLVVEQAYDFTAMYNCSEGYIMEGSWWASCYDGEISYMPECKAYIECEYPEIENGWLSDEWGSGGRYECDDGYRCKDWNCYSWCDTDSGTLNNEVECEWEENDDEEDCDFPDSIDNGWLEEDWGSGGRYECDDEYECMDGNCYAECDTSTGDMYIPECVNDDDGGSCGDWPDIENGWMSDEWDGGAKYECFDGYQMSGSNVVYCDDSGEMGDLPECYWDDGGDDGECMFPSYIEKGYMYWQGDMDDEPAIAAYRCYSPYVMQNLDVDVGKSYVEMYGIAVCYSDDSGNKQMMMPSCAEWEDVGHCGLPKEIENGEASNMTWWEDGWWAQYYCHDGYQMMETWMEFGDWGWCRGDGSMNIPRCVSSEEYWNIEFELNANGYAGIDNGGYVLARFSNNEWESDWELGCDDGVNDNAAGAVCRSLGWNHGKKITPNKKMKALEDYDFGWININCGYDDGLMTSDACEADRYGEDTALCSSSEQWAVQCYDTKWGVDASLTVNTKNGKMVCNMEMWKEDSLVSAKGMDFWVEFGARNGTAEGDLVWFDVSSKDKASAKGFKSTAKDKSYVKNSGYSCFYCKAGTGDMDLGMAWDGDC